MEYKKELSLVKAQNIDISNFETAMNDFKDKFSKNYELTSKKFKTAIEEIDKTIDHLQRLKMHYYHQKITYVLQIIRLKI